MSTRPRVPGNGMERTYSQQKPLTDEEERAKWDENRERHAAVMHGTRELLARLNSVPRSP